MCQLLAEYLAPLVVDDDTLAVDAIAEVQPGGHFFGATHTLARYEDVFYKPIVSDWRNFETWYDSGAPSAAKRCERYLETVARGVRAAAIDPGIDEALREYVAKRKRAIEAAKCRSNSERQDGRSRGTSSETLTPNTEVADLRMCSARLSDGFPLSRE